MKYLSFEEAYKTGTPFYIPLTMMLIALAIIALYLYLDVISITAPPWDYCGFHGTKAGNAFTCIRFDVDTFIIK